MFEAYIDGCKHGRATFSRRWGGHAVALLVHVALVTGAVALAPHARPAPAPLPVIAVPVHVAHLFWPASPSEPPPAVAPPAPIVASPGTAPSPRPPRRGRIAAAALPTAETPAPARAIPEPAGEPAKKTEGPPGVETAQASGADAPAAGRSTQALPSPTPSVTLRSSAPRFLPEPLANQQKIEGQAPAFPAALAVSGALYVIHARICVAPSGGVDRVELLKTAHPTLDANVRAAVAKWRYRPLLAGPVAVPFCTLARFEFRAT